MSQLNTLKGREDVISFSHCILDRLVGYCSSLTGHGGPPPYQTVQGAFTVGYTPCTLSVRKGDAKGGRRQRPASHLYKFDTPT